MWLFLSNSFLSIVAHDKKPDMLVVRARVRGDIEAVFPDAKVRDTTRTKRKGGQRFDYGFRAEIPRSIISNAIMHNIDTIDYTNFKSSVHDHDRHWTYLRVWRDMAEWQNQLTKEGWQ